MPLFCDATAKGAYFPSLYACHLYPNVTKAIDINEGVD